MGIIKADNDDVILDAGAGQGTKFKVDGTEVASVSSTGAFTSTTIDATKLSGALPAIDGSNLTGVGGTVATTIFSSASGVGSGTITLSGSFTGYTYLRFTVGRASKAIVFNVLAEQATFYSAPTYAMYGYNSEHIYINRVNDTTLNVGSSGGLLCFAIEGID